jgi:rRNA-processing protein FCF1
MSENNNQKIIKPLCIMDTNAIINSYNVELSGQRVIGWIKQLRDIVIPISVKDELNRCSLDGRIKNEIFSKYVYQTIEKAHFKECREWMEKWFNINNKIEICKKLSDADKDCVALALFKAINTRNLVILSTDELNLKEELNKFLIDQNAGLLLTTPEMIVYFYSLYRPISRDNVIRAFQMFRDIGYSNEHFKKYLEKKCRFMFECSQGCLV